MIVASGIETREHDAMKEVEGHREHGTTAPRPQSSSLGLNLAIAARMLVTMPAASV